MLLGIVNHMKGYSDPFYQFPKNETITLTRDNFTEVTRKEEFMVVMFYAPWSDFAMTTQFCL